MRAVVKNQNNGRRITIASLFGESSGHHGVFIERQPEFFVDLPAQRKTWIFATFHFPARKFPLPGVRLFGQRLLQEHASSRVAQERSDDQ